MFSKSNSIQNIILVTGGLGFIGKHFIKYLLRNKRNFIYNVDCGTYAADYDYNEEFLLHSNYVYINKKIEEIEELPPCDYIFNFAAESHVDNSIASGDRFIKSNILGVHNLLEKIREKQSYDRPLFIQISTDEVYGDITDGKFNEASYLVPSNPYSASKASSEMLVRAWGRTYNIEYFIIRMTNIYGPDQYIEKLIPRTCMELSRNRKMPLHGNGKCIRTWLHIDDAISGIMTVFKKGKKNQIYNVGGVEELSNFQVVKFISDVYNIPIEEAFNKVEDRPGYDVRYSLDNSKIKALGWSPKKRFKKEIGDIVKSFKLEKFLHK